MSTLHRIRDTRIVSGEVRSAKQWKGEPDEETRQQYANARIWEWRRVHPSASFSDLLSTFRYYGRRYDRGYRLRDGLEGAA